MDMRIVAEELQIANLEKQRADQTTLQPRDGISAKQNSAKTDTVTESFKAIAVKQRWSTDLLSDFQGSLDLDKASYRN